MPTYIILGRFTEQGIRTVKDTTKRTQAAKELAKKLGGNLKDVYWTIGQYDVVAMLDAPDDAAVAAFGMTIGKGGNLRTETMRALNASEIEAVLTKVA